ncbi:arginase family protein [Comamonas terrigena]|uniref:arginase family protein n=1 Tax=Comamonas terrigena TaxID=32013 RepID=UPI0024483C68|nr:arginase family protein [Comamonas terrigena]MDH1701057.1 arginase family protein [Comamonas terrigena]
MPISPSRTLRLNIAQWQGSDRPDYLIGGRVLAALAPAASGPEVTIDVPPSATAVRPVADGIASKAELLAIAERAMAAIRQHQPEAIVTLGGDCLVDLAPMAYLNEQYGDDLAILWVDAHPDIMGAAQMRNAHAHVLGMLMGEGDPDFGRLVKRPIRPQQVLYVGLTETTPYETEFLDQRQMQRLSPEQIAQYPDAVVSWLRHTGATKVAVHFDLDVLDAARYSFLLFNDPAAAAGTWDGVAQGRMRLEDIARILQQANEVAEVVGLAIAEYLPWDAIQLAKALRTLPLLNR